MHPLDGPNLKIGRSAYHVQTLNDFISTWKNTEPFICSGQANTDKSAYIYTIEIKAIPGGIGAVIGDILHNLRSALDNLVWQLALLTTATPYRKTAFPIFLNDNPDAQREINRLLQDVSNDPRKVIELCQPYNAINPIAAPLWILHELSDCDKHRVLTLKGQQLGFDMRAGMVEHWLNDDTVEITVPILDENFPPPPPKIFCDKLVITDRSGTLYSVEVVEAIHQFIRDSVFPRLTRFFP